MAGLSTRTGLVLGLVAVLGLSACTTSEENRERTVEAMSAEEIFRKAEFELEDRRPDDAAVLFGEVERLYPYSEWAKRGLIMQAF